jgi:hypothetical protein
MEDTTQAHCNYCSGTRQHDLLFSHRVVDESDEGYGPWSISIHELLACKGCNTVCVRHKQQFSEDTIWEEEPPVHVSYYPPALYRRLPQWFNLLDMQEAFKPICGLIREIYTALQNDSRRLAVMGIRSLVEHVMIDKVGDNNSFAKNLDEFHRAGYISRVQRDVLAITIEAGHAVMHRNFNPELGDLVSLISVVENILESIYVNELNLFDVKERIPTRTK